MSQTFIILLKIIGGSNYSLNTSCTVYNNVLYQSRALEEVILKSNNWIVTDTSAFWADESQSDTKDYNDANTYKLSDQARKKITLVLMENKSGYTAVVFHSTPH